MKVLNVGSLNIDYTYQVNHIVAPGETIASNSLGVFAGGKGLNQSIALARAGAKVFHAGKIGSDGQFLIDLCNESGVDTSFVEVGKTRTGNAIIQVSNEGQNSIILYPGANRELEKEYLDKVLSNFNEGDILLLQNEVNLVDYLIEQASSKGMLIYLNPSPFDDYIKTCDLSKINTFLMNEVEGFQITGHEKPEDILDYMHSNYQNANVVLTLGKDGAYFQNSKERIFQPARVVDAIDTTGAGDTFTGYFIAAIIEGKTSQEALLLATNASSLAVMKPGAANAIPMRDVVNLEL